MIGAHLSNGDSQESPLDPGQCSSIISGIVPALALLLCPVHPTDCIRPAPSSLAAPIPLIALSIPLIALSIPLIALDLPEALELQHKGHLIMLCDPFD